MEIRIVVTGRSYHTAAAVPETLVLDEGASLDDALQLINEALEEGAALPGSCLIAIDNQHMGTVASHSNTALQCGQELVLIAPVAGG